MASKWPICDPQDSKRWHRVQNGPRKGKDKPVCERRCEKQVHGLAGLGVELGGLPCSE